MQVQILPGPLTDNSKRRLAMILKCDCTNSTADVKLAEPIKLKGPAKRRPKADKRSV